MIVYIVYGLVLLTLCALLGYTMRRLHKAEVHIINMSMKLAEVEDLANRVDSSTGTSLHELTRKFDEFNTLYGEAAIEEMREAAKAQKTWADGLNNVMSYGARFQGRGDTT